MSINAVYAKIQNMEFAIEETKDSNKLMLDKLEKLSTPFLIITTLSDQATLIKNYLSNGYKSLNKNIISDNIKNINKNFWYLCIDHYSHQEKGSYWNDCYDCSPRHEFTKNHKKIKTIRLNGYVLSKFDLL